MAITVKNMRKSPGYLLRCAHQYAVAIVSEHLAPLGLTTMQFSTLVALNEHPGLDATRLVLEARDGTLWLGTLEVQLLQLGRGTEAIARFEAALRAKPDFPEPCFNLANTLAQAGRTAEALTHYDFYLRMKPDDVEARSNYAATLQITRRFDDAITQLEFAVKLRPADAELQNNLGAALAQAGRPAEALRRFQEALRLRPDFARARENLERATRATGGR